MCVLRALAGGMSHSCFYSRVWVEYKLLLQHADARIVRHSTLAIGM